MRRGGGGDGGREGEGGVCRGIYSLLRTQEGGQRERVGGGREIRSEQWEKEREKYIGNGRDGWGEEGTWMGFLGSLSLSLW